MIRFNRVGLIAVIAAALVLAAAAQEQTKQPVSPAQKHLSYTPELADLMNITQTRFTRLSYAPEHGNWQLAAYEAAHLRKSFDTAVRLYPVFGDVKQKRLIQDATEPALDSIDKAISSKDLASFTKVIETLRLTCNNCHFKANVGFILIGSPYKALTGPR